MRGKGPRGTGCYHRPRVPGPSTLQWALPDPQNSGEAETHLKKPKDLKDSIVLSISVYYYLVSKGIRISLIAVFYIVQY